MFVWIFRVCVLESKSSSLELDHLSLSLLVTAQLEVLATLQWCLLAELAVCAFHTQDDFLGGLGLKHIQERTAQMSLTHLQIN